MWALKEVSWICGQPTPGAGSLLGVLCCLVQLALSSLLITAQPRHCGGLVTFGALFLRFLTVKGSDTEYLKHSSHWQGGGTRTVSRKVYPGDPLPRLWFGLSREWT